MKKRIVVMVAFSAMLIAGKHSIAGEGNKFDFDKTLYNLADQKETTIKVKEDKGYKFSGNSIVLSGQSKINGITVKLNLSKSANDTQVNGFFKPTGEIPNEKEMWVPSQKVTVVNHYIKSATYRHKGSKVREQTVYNAMVVAKPSGLGTPHVKIQPTGLDLIPFEVRQTPNGNYNLKIETNGHRQGGKIISTFSGDIKSGECVKVGGK